MSWVKQRGASGGAAYLCIHCFVLHVYRNSGLFVRLKKKRGGGGGRLRLRDFRLFLFVFVLVRSDPPPLGSL